LGYPLEVVEINDQRKSQDKLPQNGRFLKDYERQYGSAPGQTTKGGTRPHGVGFCRWGGEEGQRVLANPKKVS